ncbi:S-adenosyl-L-methionine-dependent methyltransferase, partial [Mycena latifolia]
GFNWRELPQNVLIVDVGGGIGSTSLEIAWANPHLPFLIQDKAAVVLEGKEHWERELPGALAARVVSFQAHDFFGTQPIVNPDIFLVRYICRDWSDAYTLKILSQLRAAAQPTTKLLVLERIVRFVCGEDDSYSHIPGAIPEIMPPKPLLANMGVVGMVPYLIDMQTMALLNGCERTFPHFYTLFKEAGWEIEEIYRDVDSLQAVQKAHFPCIV